MNRFRMYRRFSKFALPLFAIAGLLLGTVSADDQATSDPPPADIQIQSGHLGRWSTEDGDETRVLLLRIAVTNQITDQMTIGRANWSLTTETRELPAIPLPSAMTHLTIHMGGERVALNSVKTAQLTIAPKQKSSTWLVFKDLPDGDQIPGLTLTCDIPRVAKVQIDVEQTFANRLKLNQRKVGPANAIALLTIDGALDTVNVGMLAQQIDLLSADQICRIIINFGSKADVPDRNVSGWLRQVAIQSGRNPVVNRNFPAISSSIVDLHYVDHQTSQEPEEADRKTARLPDPFAEEAWNGASRNIHRHLSGAVDSAVAPLCDMVSRDELARTLRHADRLTKSAVLRHGAERLIDNHLLTILALTDGRDAIISEAAVFALRNSGNPEAIQALVSIAVTDDTSTPAPESDTSARDASNRRRAIAVQSLAASKYASAHSELLRLLPTDDEVLRTSTAQAIAANPRPVWSEPLGVLVQQANDAERIELLPALAAVGHPRLLTILANCLASDEPELSTTALELLIDRQEPVAEQLASEWMLKHLETSSPSPQVLAFLRRTRDHRAVPLLLKHLDGKTTDNSELLTTVLSIGDDRVAEQIAADFSRFDADGQLLILNALDEVHSNLFWKLTEKILERPHISTDKSLSGIVSLLQKSGSDRAVFQLVNLLSRLESEENHLRQNYTAVCTALASTGTPAARDALRAAARNSGANAEVAKLSLTQLYLRSPAQGYVNRGSMALKGGNTSMAMLFLEAAVKTDPELPDARLWRGNVTLHIKQPSNQQLESARSDFQRYVELEPDESEGHIGLALVLVRQGNIEDGISAGMAIHNQSKEDSVYLYNMACVYGRAIEHIESQPENTTPDQKSQIEQFRLRGVNLLQQSIDNDLDDDNLAWMQQDPDLETIRQSPEFTRLVEKTLGGNEKKPKPQEQ